MLSAIISHQEKFFFFKFISKHRQISLSIHIQISTNISFQEETKREEHTYKTAIHSISTSVLSGKVLTATQLPIAPKNVSFLLPQKEMLIII